jgi:hypothetical protein
VHVNVLADVNWLRGDTNWLSVLEDDIALAELAYAEFVARRDVAPGDDSSAAWYFDLLAGLRVLKHDHH